MVLAQTLLDFKAGHGAAFEVAVHFGTLLSVIVVYRSDVFQLTRVSLGAVLKPQRLLAHQDDPDLKMAVAIVLGCIPAAIVGLAFKDQLEAFFDSPRLVCGALIGTGLFLLATRLAKRGDKDVGYVSGIMIGIAQAIAIIPGVSRAGSTISLAMFLGIDRTQAARYSFLLSLPVIFGASLLKARDLAQADLTNDVWMQFAIGAIVSFVAGVGALLLLLRIVQRGGFAHFGWYCLSVGIVGLVAL